MFRTFRKRLLIIWETESHFNLQLQSEFLTPIIPKHLKTRLFFYQYSNGKRHVIGQTIRIPDKMVRYLDHGLNAKHSPI